MGLLFQHEAHLIGHNSTVAHNDMRQIHKGVGHLTSLVDHPRLLGLPQEMLQALADNASTDIQDEVGHIALVVRHHRDRLVEVGVHGLTGNEHRALSLHEHADDMRQHMRLDISRSECYLPFFGQRSHREVEQRFGDGHIDMHGRITDNQRLVDQTVAIPPFFLIARLGQ